MITKEQYIAAKKMLAEMISADEENYVSNRRSSEPSYVSTTLVRKVDEIIKKMMPYAPKSEVIKEWVKALVAIKEELKVH